MDLVEKYIESVASLCPVDTTKRIEFPSEVERNRVYERQAISLMGVSGMLGRRKHHTGLTTFYSYSIGKSCRLNDDASPLPTITRTQGAGDSQRKMTFSLWLKRCNLGLDTAVLFGAYTSADAYSVIQFNSANQLQVVHQTGGGGLEIDCATNMVFRDTTNWYHVVVAIDTTQATNSNGIKIYVNGTQRTIAFTGYTQNSDLLFGANGVVESVGCINDLDQFDGLLAEVIKVDNQQLTGASFGETKCNVWIPAIYSGAYGTEGYRLNFATNNDMGNDVSGNAGDFATANVETTDQLVDSPTNNHCTWNSLKPSSGTFANGNLGVSGTEDAIGTFGVSSGKWAWKITVAEEGVFGVENEDGTEYTATDLLGEVVEFELDLTGMTLKKRVDGGALETVQDPIAAGFTWFPLAKAACTADFGQLSFTPTDATFYVLKSSNLTTPAWLTDYNEDHADDGFNVAIWTGTGAEKAVTGIGHQPNLVIVKSRTEGAINYTGSWSVYDSVRTATKRVKCEDGSAEETVAQGLKSFDVDGFTLGTDNEHNYTGDSFVAFCWKESTVYGLDVVAYTGDGNAKAVDHGLGVVPGLIIVKNRTALTTDSWAVYHRKLDATAPEDYNLILDTNVVRADEDDVWNDTAPTTTVFTVGKAAGAADHRVNANTETYIAYVFAEKDGFSKFGSYVGNANADGPFAWCGFKPKVVMTKNAIGSGEWLIWDTERSTENVIDDPLQPHDSVAEDTGGSNDIDFLSNGFKVRAEAGAFNGSTNTIVFVAFAENPFKFSNSF